MIGKILRKIKAFSTIINLSSREPNDYAFGYKVRRILSYYKDKKEIKEEEIFKETPKP
jgi:hypothetical protein